jgi:hypothetical protein
LLLHLDHLQNQRRVRERRKISDQKRSLIKLADIELDGLTDLAVRRCRHHFSGMNRLTARGISFRTKLPHPFKDQKLDWRTLVKFENRSPAGHTCGKGWSGDLDGRGVCRHLQKDGAAPEIQLPGPFIKTEDRIRAQARDGRIGESKFGA